MIDLWQQIWRPAETLPYMQLLIQGTWRVCERNQTGEGVTAVKAKKYITFWPNLCYSPDMTPCAKSRLTFVLILRLWCSCFLNTHVESHQNLNICFHVYRWGAYVCYGLLIYTEVINWSSIWSVYSTRSQWFCLVLRISPLCECLFFSEVWNWYLAPLMSVLYPAWTADIYNGPASVLFFLLSVLCRKYCLILSWCRPPVCVCRAAWGRGVQLWSEGEEIWGTPAPKGPAVWLHVNKDTAVFLFGASDRMSAWFGRRSPFGLVLESAAKIWQWRNRYNFILQQERSRSFLRGWIIESRLLEPFGEFKWRFAAVETPGSSSVVIWNNCVGSTQISI